MSDLESICARVPADVWRQVSKSGSDMKWRSWWNLRWYTDDGHKIDGFRPQSIRNVEHREIPYKRSPFGPSGMNRFGLPSGNVAYFGVDHSTATCETMTRFRGQIASTSEEVLDYLRGASPSGETSKGYSEEYKLDIAAKVVDLRRNDNTLFKYIAEAGGWADCEDFAQNVAYSKEEVVIPETQAIAQAAFGAGFDGIWYRSVRTPRNLFINSGECLVLFEGHEALLHPFGSTSTMKNLTSRSSR